MENNIVWNTEADTVRYASISIENEYKHIDKYNIYTHMYLYVNSLYALAGIDA